MATTETRSEDSVDKALRRLSYAVTAAIVFSGAVLIVGILGYVIGLASGAAYVRIELGGVLLTIAYVMILVALYRVQGTLEALAARRP